MVLDAILAYLRIRRLVMIEVHRAALIPLFPVIMSRGQG